MTRTTSVVLLALTILLAAASAPISAQERDADVEIELHSDLVLVPISVRHENGGMVRDLKAEELRVAEDGHGQKIEFFSLDTAPLDVVLLVDASGSVGGSMDVIRASALAFTKQLRPDDAISIVAFSDRPVILQEWTSDLKRVATTLRTIEPAGATALYGSVVATVYERFALRSPERRRAVVVLTDGDDTISTVTSRSAARAAIRHDASVYVISVNRIVREVLEQLSSNSGIPVARRFEYSSGVDQLRRAEERLGHLAEETGGRVIDVKRIGDLKRAYGEIAEEIRSRYLIGYYPSSDAGAGFHAIAVSTVRRNVRVHARHGYYRE